MKGFVFRFGEAVEKLGRRFRSVLLYRIGNGLKRSVVA
jgi:hypothetical protein